MHALGSAFNRAFRQIIGPVLGASVVAYFAYHTVQGDRGLVALTHLQGEVEEASRVLADVRHEREQLEHRARLLRPDNLDPDMLEERARLLLNKTHPDDLVILLPGRPAPQSPQDTQPVSR
ncbi:FtsB family cell division protein [Rhodocista pekingensis]|uniref:Septum formation initiator family protein n=1 Tax=Rhodocista pekingensis TaxID=201185 RepID=A0ABW2KRH2_9PROT